jgi:hypothetical protein
MNATAVHHPMLSLLARSLEFGFYHCLLSVVDRVSRLPRNTTMPEAARLYRENIALKAQLDVLELRLKREEAAEKPKPVGSPKRSLKERASQVFAYLLTPALLQNILELSGCKCTKLFSAESTC